MAKTSYVVVINPSYDFTEADNPNQAMEEYKKKYPRIHGDIAIVPRSAFKLNGKRIPYRTG